MQVFTKNGPVYVLWIKAKIVMPELIATTDTVDFGKVLVGTRMKRYIRFENIS